MTIDTNIAKEAPAATTLTPADVPLREGPPTREELLAYYPSRFTWTQLKAFVNSGDLGMLKRDKKLQARYNTWAAGIREKHGSMINYLLEHRLQWGKPDRLSRLKSVLDPPASELVETTNGTSTPEIPPDAPAYFKADTPPALISIIMNDWPYSVPADIEHALIWTRLPILPPDLPASIRPRVHQDGLWGFTGSDEPPPSPSTLPSALPALADWGVTSLDHLVISPKGTPEEEELVRKAGDEIATFVKRRWNESEWETAWFVNPPRLQSVPGLSHIHVFAKHKKAAEPTS